MLRYGIENCSTMPNTINMMMCMSVDYVLRIFPVWPKVTDARFNNIRACGAFLVSGEMKGGAIQPVKILSEVGYPCTMINPWSGKTVAVQGDDKLVKKFTGDRFTFETKRGGKYTILPAGK